MILLLLFTVFYSSLSAFAHQASLEIELIEDLKDATVFYRTPESNGKPVPSPLKLRDIIVKQQEILSDEQYDYFDSIRAQIFGQNAFVVQTKSFVREDEIVANSAEQSLFSPIYVISKNGQKMYLMNTTANVVRLNETISSVARLLEKETSVIFGGIHPCFRPEDIGREQAGWRQPVFPQIDIEVAAKQDISEEQKFQIDLAAVEKMIEGILISGIPPENLQIRLNDHSRILRGIFKLNGLSDKQMSHLHDLFDDYAKSRVNGVDIELHKAALEAELCKYQFASESQQFLAKVVNNGIYDFSLLMDPKYKHINVSYARLQRLASTTLKRFKSRIKVVIDPNLHRTPKYKSFGMQADIITSIKTYAEIAGGGGDFATGQFYMSGAALGSYRILSVRNELALGGVRNSVDLTILKDPVNE